MVRISASPAPEEIFVSPAFSANLNFGHKGFIHAKSDVRNSPNPCTPVLARFVRAHGHTRDSLDLYGGCLWLNTARNLPSLLLSARGFATRQVLADLTARPTPCVPESRAIVYEGEAPGTQHTVARSCLGEQQVSIFCGDVGGMTFVMRARS